MFKKVITSVLSIVLVICIAVPAFAATEDNVLTYDLNVDGSNSITANPNDIITVTYTIAASARSATSTTQNQIIYDHNFFELVSGSINTEPDYSSVFTTSNPIESDGTHYIFYNSVSNVIFTAGTSAKIGTFQLKVKANAGSSVVRNTQFFATDKEAKLFAAESKDLTVTVNGNNAVLVTGISLNKQSAALKAGETVTLSATVAPADATNQNVAWSSSNSAVAAVDSKGTVTAIAEGTTVITATTQDGGKTATCTVTVTKNDEPVITAACNAGGTITPSGAQIVKKGEDLTFTFKANENYAIKDVKIDGVSNAEAIESGSYTFRSVEENHTIAVAFEKTGGAPVINPFSDVKEGEYYYDAVLWAAENGITQGTDATHFSPDVPVNRAQVVTFLWRAAGCPEPTDSAGKFTDVQRGSYYEKAVTWAVAQGITKGTSETTFSPDSICTRGQIVTFLARFAGVADANTASVFTDVKTTDYFAAAVKWAKDNGVTSGTSATTFSPNADCTRGQIVTFLYRWMVR